MNDQPAAQPNAPAQPRVHEYLRDLQERRRRAFLFLMDCAAPRAVRHEWIAYIDVAVANLGRKGLERVIWPWQHQEQGQRVPRGRLSNPTALR